MAAEALAEVCGCEAARQLPPLIQRLLAQRGLADRDAISNFLNPRLSQLSAPELLPNMPAAVARLLQAIDAQETVVLYGDYDVDGVTSLTILTRVLSAAGLAVKTFLPHRQAEGYGLSEEGLRRCLEEHAPTLLVAVDCGTARTFPVTQKKEPALPPALSEEEPMN